jgi:hypothetical protein
LGARARETVREHFLMSRLLEDWIDFLATHKNTHRHIGADGSRPVKIEPGLSN